MRIVLYAAVTADGFIARENGDTDWVADDDLFEQTCKDSGCVVMGRATFDEFGGPPFEGVHWIVLSGKVESSKYKDVIFVGSAVQAIDRAKKYGCAELLVIGGAKTYRSFMETKKVQKVMLDIHPIVLGCGINLFDGYSKNNQLKLTSSKTHAEGFVHIEYELVESS